MRHFEICCFRPHLGAHSGLRVIHDSGNMNDELWVMLFSLSLGKGRFVFFVYDVLSSQASAPTIVATLLSATVLLPVDDHDRSYHSSGSVDSVWYL